MSVQGLLPRARMRSKGWSDRVCLLSVMYVLLGYLFFSVSPPPPPPLLFTTGSSITVGCVSIHTCTYFFCIFVHIRMYMYIRTCLRQHFSYLPPSLQFPQPPLPGDKLVLVLLLLELHQLMESESWRIKMKLSIIITGTVNLLLKLSPILLSFCRTMAKGEYYIVCIRLILWTPDASLIPLLQGHILHHKTRL